jgi:hypothetical protein
MKLMKERRRLPFAIVLFFLVALPLMILPSSAVIDQASEDGPGEGGLDGNTAAVNGSTENLLSMGTSEDLPNGLPEASDGPKVANETPAIKVGGDKGYYLFHCNIDGAEVSFDEKVKGVITNGMLLVQVYLTATPYHNYSVSKEGYITVDGPLRPYPAKDQTKDINVTLTLSPYPDANWTRTEYPDANWTRTEYPDANWTRTEYPDANWTRTEYPDEDHGRAASFRATLEANGFIVTSGQMTPINPIVDLLDSHIGDSANGNNAGQPYKVLMVPISPFGEENPFERGITIFRLRPDEAVVYLGPTPPQCDYFSFQVFLWVRHKDSLVRKGDWMNAAVNDPLNSALIKTEGNGTPFRKQTIVIFTADRGVYERVAALAQEAGYPESMINPYVIPSGLLNLGVFPETPLADSFIILMRTANFVSKAEGNHYLSDDHYARVWRVTPEESLTLDPYPTPEQRVRTWKSESELYPDLNNGLERLEKAILNQTPHVQYESYESIRWFAESREVLEETDRDSPLYHKFVAGEASDTPYLRTSLSGEAANFTLASDDMVVVYGVNHAATGLATYSNFGVYGDWITSSCQDDPPKYLFGCGDRSWNGVVSMTNHAFTGSAEEYIPGDPMAPYLYAVKVLRQPPQDKHDKYFVIVPTATPEHPCASPGYCLGLDDPIIIGYRAYLNPATASGADYDDIIHDRAIWFRLRE